MDQYEEVIRLVFAAINKLKEEGPKEHVIKELQTMSDLKFTFLTTKPARVTANNLARQLNDWRGGPHKNDCSI